MSDIKVVLDADTASFDAKIKASAQTTSSLGDAADNVSEKSKAFADKWVANMRRMDENTKAKIEGLKGAMKNLVDPNEIRKVEDQIAKLNAALGNLGNAGGGGATGLSKEQRQRNMMLQNMSFQLQDVFVQTRDTESFFRAFGQQLPQMLIGFGMAGAAIGALFSVLPLLGNQIKSLFDPIARATSKLEDMTKPLTDLREEMAKPMETFMKFMKAPVSDPFMSIYEKALVSGNLPELEQTVKIQLMMVEEEYKKAQKKVEWLQSGKSFNANTNASGDMSGYQDEADTSGVDPKELALAERNRDRLEKQKQYEEAKRTLLSDTATLEEKLAAQARLRDKEASDRNTNTLLQLEDQKEKLKTLTEAYKDSAQVELRKVSRQIEQRQYELGAGERELDRQRSEARATADRIADLARRMNKGETGDAAPTTAYVKGVKELTQALAASKKTPEIYKAYYEDLAKIKKNYEQQIYGDLVKEDFLQVYVDRVKLLTKALNDGKITQKTFDEQMKKATRNYEFGMADDDGKKQIEQREALEKDAKDFIAKMGTLNADARITEIERIKSQHDAKFLNEQQFHAKMLEANKQYIQQMEDQAAQYDPVARSKKAYDDWAKQENFITELRKNNTIDATQEDKYRAANAEKRAEAEKSTLKGINNLYRNHLDMIKSKEEDLNKLKEMRNNTNDAQQMEFLNGKIADMTKEIYRAKGGLESMAVDFTEKFTDKIVDGLSSGKFALKDFIGTMLKDWAAMIMKRQMMDMQLYIIEKALGFIKGGFGAGPNLAGGSVLGNSAAAPGIGDGMGDSVDSLGAAALPFSNQAFAQLASNSVANKSPQQNVTVNVNNTAGVEVKTQQTKREDGTMSIDIILEKKVQEMMASGTLDNQMANFYGVQRRAS